MGEHKTRRGVRFERVLLKISGEGFGKAGEKGVDPFEVARIARQLQEVHALGREVAVVMGAGNLVRGALFEASGMDRVTADHMGMVATMINALSLQDQLEQLGVEVRTLTALPTGNVVESYVRRRAIRHLKEGRIVLLAGGTGHPFFTTDTTAALRAAEIGADVLLKATQVDGVYDADPATTPTARRFDHLDYMEVVRERYRVMDLTAIAMCMEQQLPIVVFNLWEPGNMKRVVEGAPVGTLIGGEAPAPSLPAGGAAPAEESVNHAS